jgi:hypothetical protein
MFYKLEARALNEKTSDNRCYNEIIEKIQIKHTPSDSISDRYYNKNTIVGLDVCNVYDISEKHFFERLLDCIRVVMYTGSSFILSENKSPIVHCKIIR